MGEMADDMVDGWTCSHCGTYFKSSHGYRVLCRSCFETDGGDCNDRNKVGKSGIPLTLEQEI